MPCWIKGFAKRIKEEARLKKRASLYAENNIIVNILFQDFLFLLKKDTWQNR